MQSLRRSNRLSENWIQERSGPSAKKYPHFCKIADTVGWRKLSDHTLDQWFPEHLTQTAETDTFFLNSTVNIDPLLYTLPALIQCFLCTIYIMACSLIILFNIIIIIIAQSFVNGQVGLNNNIIILNTWTM